MRTVAIIQARLGSTRFPRKVLAKIGRKTMIQHVIERTQRIRGVDEIVVAVPCGDEEILRRSLDSSVSGFPFRGDSTDVLARYYSAAAYFGADVIVRITADCPLLNVAASYELLWIWRNDSPQPEYLTNQWTGADGWDTEIFTFGALARAFHMSHDAAERGHVGPAVRRFSSGFKTTKADAIPNGEKWSVDTEADLELVRRRYAEGW